MRYHLFRLPLNVQYYGEDCEALALTRRDLAILFTTWTHGKGSKGDLRGKNKNATCEGVEMNSAIVVAPKAPAIVVAPKAPIRVSFVELSSDAVRLIMTFLSDGEEKFLKWIQSKRITYSPKGRFQPRCPESRDNLRTLSVLRLNICNLTGECIVFFFARNHCNIYTCGDH